MISGTVQCVLLRWHYEIQWFCEIVCHRWRNSHFKINFVFDCFIPVLIPFEFNLKSENSENNFLQYFELPDNYTTLRYFQWYVNAHALFVMICSLVKGCFDWTSSSRSESNASEIWWMSHMNCFSLEWLWNSCHVNFHWNADYISLIIPCSFYKLTTGLWPYLTEFFWRILCSTKGYSLCLTQ